MKLTAPSFLPHPLTPTARPGLALASTASHDESGAWFFGSLCIPDGAEGTALSWLTSIRVIAIAEGAEPPFAGAPSRFRELLTPPAWTPALLPEGPHRRLVFNVHSAGLFERPLPAGKIQVHAAAGKLLSAPISLERGTPGPLPKGRAPSEWLTRAYDLLLRGKAAEAVVAFTAALEQPAVAAELDGAHRYNAACAAMRAAAALDAAAPLGQPKPPRAEALRAQAKQWLSEDLQSRAQLHTRRSFAWAARKEAPSLLAELDAVYRDHAAHLRDDADLAGIAL